MTPILPELSELAPERFTPGTQTAFRTWYVRIGWKMVQTHEGQADFGAKIQAACQAECEERGWWWQLESPVFDGDPYRASINPKPYATGISSYATADSAFLAIATALLDAIKAQ